MTRGDLGLNHTKNDALIDSVSGTGMRDRVTRGTTPHNDDRFSWFSTVYVCPLIHGYLKGHSLPMAAVKSWWVQ